jgi:hypothetical protein
MTDETTSTLLQLLAVDMTARPKASLRERIRIRLRNHAQSPRPSPYYSCIAGLLRSSTTPMLLFLSCKGGTLPKLGIATRAGQLWGQHWREFPNSLKLWRYIIGTK